MYQPAHARFSVGDAAALLAELAAHVPATLVTLNAGSLRASILPMLFDADDGAYGTLRGHLARPNPQWRDVSTDVEALAIFDGPDAYITPAWYEEKRATGKVVPTWNYVTVQAHGRLTLRHEPEWLVAHVRRLVDRHEAPRERPWSVDDAPDGYVETQVRAIVGLELRINRLEAKRKLGQNRSAADFAGVIEGLATGSPAEQPGADEQNAFLESHSWDLYAAWHLGLTEGANDETKARYAFVLGDFKRIHRSGIIACHYRAAEWRHKEVELAAHRLLQHLDSKLD